MNVWPENSGAASLHHVNDEQTRIDVDARTLDSYELDDVTLIKIDVQGHEHDVLMGSLDTIERSRPVLCVELPRKYKNDKKEYERVSGFLETMNYVPCERKTVKDVIFISQS